MISGIIATSATVPNASVNMFPPTALHTPIAKGSINVADIGPDATPPESKAIAVKIEGTKNDITRAIKYPGTTSHKMLIPVRTLIMDSAIAKDIATCRLLSISLLVTAPALISSTCLVRVCTAGSADTTNQPIMAYIGISKYLVQPLVSVCPRISPKEEKPTFTPIRKITSPIYVKSIPKRILSTDSRFK